MLHAKFQDDRTSGSGEEYLFNAFTIYHRGGQFSHVIYNIYTNVCSPSLGSA